MKNGELKSPSILQKRQSSSLLSQLEANALSSKKEERTNDDPPRRRSNDVVTPAVRLGQSADLPPRDPRKPSNKSFVVAVSYTVLNVTSFTIAVPTSKQYTEFFGVSDTLVGVLVGVFPLISALMQPLLIPIFRRYPLHGIVLVMDAISVTANIVYALGSVTGSYSTVILARALSGVATGTSFTSTYIARSTDASARSKYMEYMSVGIGVGYSLGPLLGLLLGVVCGNKEWSGNLLFNSNTSPGWLMAFLFLVHGICVHWAFEEPPMPKPNEPKTEAEFGNSGRNNGHGKKDGDLPLKEMILCCFLVYLIPINVGAWEVVTVFYGTGPWEWSMEWTALYLALLNGLPVILSCVHIERWIKLDRTGIAVSFLGLVLATLFLFDYAIPSIAGRASVYGVGSIILLFSGQIGKAFLFSKVSKLPASPRHRQLLINASSMFYILGRATGAIVSPHLVGPIFGALTLAINATALLVLLGFRNDFKDA